MRVLARWPLLGALVAVSALWLFSANGVAAECLGPLDSWPSFRQAAHTAQTVVVGEVVESLLDNPPDFAVWFRMRVDQVLKGQSEPVIAFEGLQSGEGLRCPSDSFLRPHVGDTIAIASDGLLPTVDNGYVHGTLLARPDVAVVFIEGEPNLTFMPRIQTMTLAQVSSVIMPDTDTVGTSAPSAPAGDADLEFGKFVGILFAAVVAIIALHRRRRDLQEGA